MFNFLNLGFDGYRRIAQADLANARLLSRALEGSGYFTVCLDYCCYLPGSLPMHGILQCASDIHIPLDTSKEGKALGNIDESDAEFYRKGLPVVAFR